MQFMIKKTAKSIIVYVLGRQVRQLVRKNSVKVIGVVGSIGKTSTKFALSSLLQQQFRVQMQHGNYNDIVTVPLVFFGHTNPPNVTNPLAWLKILRDNQRQLHRPYPYDVVVLELGTDGPGQIAAFGQYLKLDIAVLTAIAPEHMEFFADLEAVAREEMSVKNYSNVVLANHDLCAQYLGGVPGAQTYGKIAGDYRYSSLSFSGTTYTFEVVHAGKKVLSGSHEVIADFELYSILAAAAVGNMLEMTTEHMRAGIAAIKPAPGRMQRLPGIKHSIILDDSYNSSPDAARAALQTIYRLEAPQKIVLLGNMNELGDYSPKAHTELGKLCDPKQLDWVVTLGPDANKYTAAAAQERGCSVRTCTSPQEAGQFISENLADHALILIKGSQNGVFAEEAVKILLVDPADQQKLVRQSRQWLDKKHRQFPGV